MNAHHPAASPIGPPRNITDALSRADTPEHELLTLPIQSPTHVYALCERHPTSAAVTDRAVRLLCGILPEGTDVGIAMLKLVRKQPALNPGQLEQLTEALLIEPGGPSVTLAVTAIKEHRAYDTELFCRVLLNQPARLLDYAAPQTIYGSQVIVGEKLARQYHPLVETLPNSQQERPRRPGDPGTPTVRVALLDRYAEQADASRSDLLDVLAKVAPTWAGTGWDLLEAAVAILTR